MVERSWFNPHIFKFETYNRSINTPVNDLVHTAVRKYYIEIFIISDPGQYQNYLLLDKVSIVNQTLQDNILIKTGVKKDFNEELNDLNEKKFKLSKEELLSIIRYLKKISGTSKGRSAVGGAGLKRVVYRDSITIIGTHFAGVLNKPTSPADPAVIILNN